MTIASLLRVSERIAARQATEDTVRTVLFELSGSALHGLIVSPTSLSSMLHFLATQAFSERMPISAAAQTQQARVLSDSATGCVSILFRSHPTLSGSVDTEVGMIIAQQAATILLRAEIVCPGITSQVLKNITSEAAQVQIGSFIYILLASTHTPLGEARQRIVSLYPILARGMSLCLQAAADFLIIEDATGDGAELLSVVFAVFRLALAAARDSSEEGSSTQGLGDDAVETLWARIWPDWYRLLSLSFNPNSTNGVSLSQVIYHSLSHDLLLPGFTGRHSFNLPRPTHLPEPSTFPHLD